MYHSSSVLALPILRNSKEVRSYDSVVSVVIRLQAGRFEVQTPTKNRYLFFLQNLQAYSGFHPASCSVRNRYCSCGCKAVWVLGWPLLFLMSLLLYLRLDSHKCWHLLSWETETACHMSVRKNAPVCVHWILQAVHKSRIRSSRVSLQTDPFFSLIMYAVILVACMYIWQHIN